MQLIKTQLSCFLSEKYIANTVNKCAYFFQRTIQQKNRKIAYIDTNKL